MLSYEFYGNFISVILPFFSPAFSLDTQCLYHSYPQHFHLIFTQWNLFNIFLIGSELLCVIFLASQWLRLNLNVFKIVLTSWICIFPYRVNSLHFFLRCFNTCHHGGTTMQISMAILYVIPSITCPTNSILIPYDLTPQIIQVYLCVIVFPLQCLSSE